MAIQTATTGDLEQAQRIVIASCLMATEHNEPCVAMGTTKFKLAKGEKSLTVPNVAQVSAQALTDGVDLVDSVDIGLAYVSAAPDEVGLKFILTDKLVRQFNEDVFKIIGTQLGNGMARKRDTDVITLFASLSLGVGADNATLHATNAMGAIAYAVAQKFPSPMVFIHHPNAIAALSRSAQAIATASAGLTVVNPAGLSPMSAELARNFFGITLNGIPFYHDGNIAVIAAVDSGYGALLGNGCLGFLESLAPTTERERDASLRAWEVVMVTDYKAFEVMDAWGAYARYEIGALTHNSTA